MSADFQERFVATRRLRLTGLLLLALWAVLAGLLLRVWLGQRAAQDAAVGRERAAAQERERVRQGVEAVRADLEARFAALRKEGQEAERKALYEKLSALGEEAMAAQLRAQVDAVADLLAEARRGGMNEIEALRLLATISRWGADGERYFWVQIFDPHDPDNVRLRMHPFAEEHIGQKQLRHDPIPGTTEGMRVYHRGAIYRWGDQAVAHVRPVTLFADLDAQCRGKGWGLVKYYSALMGRPGDLFYPKLAYGRLLREWNWILVSGLPLDGIDGVLAGRLGLRDEQPEPRAPPAEAQPRAGVDEGVF